MGRQRVCGAGRTLRNPRPPDLGVRGLIGLIPAVFSCQGLDGANGKAKAVSTADEAVAVSASTADADAAAPTVAKHVTKATPTAVEVVAEAVFMAEEVVAEAASTADEVVTKVASTGEAASTAAKVDDAAGCGVGSHSRQSLSPRCQRAPCRRPRSSDATFSKRAGFSFLMHVQRHTPVPKKWRL